MITAYILLLCVSAFAMAGAGVWFGRRLLPMLGMAPGMGVAALLPAVAFLIVVSAPAPLLVGTLVLSGMAAWRAHREDGLVAMLLLAALATLIGLVGFHAPTAPYLATLPPMAGLALLGLVWFGFIFAGRFGNAHGGFFAYGALASLAAVATAPLFVPATHPLALDAALIAAALIGALLAGGYRLGIGTPARLGLGMLVSYLPLAAIWQGAWIAGLAGLAIWAIALGWGWMQQEPLDSHFPR